jgi:Molybdopterin-binding domain of aldehyde dehydrogenase
LPGAEGAATGPLAPNAFIRVGTDNLVTVICKHHEMGQGNTTGLAALVADELDADWSLVRTEYAPSDPKLYNNLAFGEIQGTGGARPPSPIRFCNTGTPGRPRGPCSSRRPPRHGRCRLARSGR